MSQNIPHVLRIFSSRTFPKQICSQHILNFLGFFTLHNLWVLTQNALVQAVLATSSITALMRERELVSPSQTNGHWPHKAAWKEKCGLRYKISFSRRYSNAGCGSNLGCWLKINDCMLRDYGAWKKTKKLDMCRIHICSGKSLTTVLILYYHSSLPGV